MKTIYTFFILGIPAGLDVEGEEGRGIQERFIRGDFKPGEHIGINQPDGALNVRADYIAAVRRRNEG